MSDAASGAPVRIRRALLSVSDKTGLVEQARKLAEKGVELVSTGGTSKLLKDAGLEVKDVADLTGFPEMMDGRVKTLHPAVHGGLLYLRDNPSHVKDAETHGIGAIDLIYVNLYPFEATVASGADFETCIENIDIGGPAMLRAAAKNGAFVAVCTDGGDVDKVLEEMDANDGEVSLPSAASSPRKPMPAPRPMMPPSPPGMPTSWAKPRRTGRPSAASCSNRSAMARTRTRKRLSTSPARSAPASPQRNSCRARNSPTTISMTQTRPMS
jgi:hypothetical protein